MQQTKNHWHGTEHVLWMKHMQSMIVGHKKKNQKLFWKKKMLLKNANIIDRNIFAYVHYVPTGFENA